MKKAFYFIGFIILVVFSFFACKTEDDDVAVPNSFTVTFYANGGIMSNGDNDNLNQKTYTVEYGSKVRPDSEEFGLTRDGFTFKGWAESPSATDSDFFDTVEIIVRSTLSLYAVWQENSTFTYYVSNTGNDSTGNGSEKSPYATLSKAIERITTSDIYTFYVSGVISDNVLFQDSRLNQISAKSIIIEGKTDAKTDAIESVKDSSAISIRTSVPLIIKNLTLRNGRGTAVASGTQGGAVYIENSSNELATVSFVSVIFEGNSAFYGGAVYNAGREVSFTSCTFTNNSSMKTGGGIYNEGLVTVLGGNFSKNEAIENGGAIYNKNSLSIENSRIFENSSNDKGGGIYNVGTFTVKTSTISENKARSGGGIYSKLGTVNHESVSLSKNSANEDGGALYIEGGSFFVLDGIMTENSAEKGSAIYNNANLTINGGEISNHTGVSPIYNDISGKFSFNSGKISKNVAINGGAVFNAGTMKLNGGNIMENTASEYGGGIYNTAMLIISNGTLSENTAIANGGGIANIGAAASCTFTYGKIEDNVALKGGGLYNESATFTMSEGSLDKLTGLFGSLIDNVASDLGGGVYLKSGRFIVSKGIISSYGRRKIGSSSFYYSGNKAGTDKGSAGIEVYSGCGNAWYKEAAATVTIDGVEQTETFIDNDVIVDVTDWIPIS